MSFKVGDIVQVSSECPIGSPSQKINLGVVTAPPEGNYVHVWFFTDVKAEQTHHGIPVDCLSEGKPTVEQRTVLDNAGTLGAKSSDNDEALTKAFRTRTGGRRRKTRKTRKSKKTRTRRRR